jgi:hypothetical protein
MRPRFASAPLRLARRVEDEDASWDVLDRRGQKCARGISLAQVRARRAAGLMPNAVLIAREDTTEWQPIDEVLERNRARHAWYVTRPGGAIVGPVSTELVMRGISEGRVPTDSLVCRSGTSAWLRLKTISVFADAVEEAEFDASATTAHSAVRYRWSFDE